MVDAAELQIRLKALSDGYAAQLPEKFGQIEQALGSLPRDGWDEEGAQTLHRMVHSLTGSGKTFGFALLSDVARKLEEYLKHEVVARKTLGEEQRKHIQIGLSELRQVALKREDLFGSIEGTVTDSLYKTQAGIAKLIFIAEDDLAQAEALKAQLGYFGYEVRMFGALDDLHSAMRENPEAVVLMDIGFPGKSRGGIKAVMDIREEQKTPVPIIFLAANTDFGARLEAVRAGCIGYMEKPVNLNSLIDRLDSLTMNLPAEPYRILVIDDSEPLTAYYSAILKQAGMEVRVVNDPLEAMAPLLDFNPDLILLDIYMPGCSGLELARVIRQVDTFVGIPIVYLSAEGDLGKQLLAMGLGADDFLTKPIQPQHLVSSVSSRVQRSRQLRSFMVRDSLTGLLNHTAIKNHLDHEMAQTKRRGTPLSFAMVDIDHFKQVNDTYGHPVGDRVIKSLSRMLRQRLRETDMVGRYGGEEFAVVMSNTDGATAARVLDAIREDFSRLIHIADGNEFSATFSCGVADASCFGDATKLGNAADKALYKAKHAGRNRVVCAEVAPVSAADLI